MLIIRLLSPRLKLLATLWIVAETLAFIAVAQRLGLGTTLLLGLGITLLGAAYLKRIGAAALFQLRGTLAGRRDTPALDALDGSLAAVAAAALILPGFLSDAIGVALAIPVVRRRVAGWVRRSGLGVRFGQGGGSGAQTIDLDRAEWTRTRPPGEPGKLVR